MELRQTMPFGSSSQLAAAYARNGMGTLSNG
jgi:hypothetical protein